jgi:hypothetical protein
MGRSVSVPSGAEIVCYLHPDLGETDETSLTMSWDDFREDLEQRLIEKYPSLTPCDKWLDNEDHVILENDLVYIGVSEYCGLVSLWVIAKENDYTTARNLNMANGFISRIKPGFEAAFGELQSMGRASNGEQFFRPLSRPEGVVSSREGVLW